MSQKPSWVTQIESLARGLPVLLVEGEEDVTESYFCDPVELWAALPMQQQARAGNSPLTLAEPIQASLPDWVAHGAMWRVLRDLYQEARLPAKLENSPVTEEATIRSILTDWHTRLAPDSVLMRYHTELDNAQTLAETTQLHAYIHGKKFFNQVVIQVLDGLFAGQGASDWLQKFRDAPIQPPPDLAGLFDQLFVQLSQVVLHE